MDDDKNLIKDVSDLYHKDLSFICEQAAKADNNHFDFWNRVFIRTAISLVEAETYLWKVDLIDHCLRYEVVIPPEVLPFLINKKYDVDNHGKIKEKFLQLPLGSDIKFTFDQICKVRNFTLKVSFDDYRWGLLIDSIGVRNRLTHPKELGAQVVTNQERLNCMSAIEWFYFNSIDFTKQSTAHKRKICEELKLQIEAIKLNTDS